MKLLALAVLLAAAAAQAPSTTASREGTESVENGAGERADVPAGVGGASQGGRSGAVDGGRNGEGDDRRNGEGDDRRDVEGDNGRSVEGDDRRDGEGDNGRNVEGDDRRNGAGDNGRNVEGDDRRSDENDGQTESGIRDDEPKVTDESVLSGLGQLVGDESYLRSADGSGFTIAAVSSQTTPSGNVRVEVTLSRAVDSFAGSLSFDATMGSHATSLIADKLGIRSERVTITPVTEGSVVIVFIIYNGNHEPPTSNTTRSSDDGLSTAAIAIVSVAGVALIAFSASIFWVCRNKQDKSNDNDTESPKSEDSTPKTIKVATADKNAPDNVYNA